MKTRRVAAVLGASLGALLAGCATPGAGTLPPVPDSLKVSSTERLSLETKAVGVQIYDCKASTDPMRFEWVFRAPEAVLFDAAGNGVGKHYAGPTWEANDGSKVVGEAKARSDGPDADAIPWLLLSAKSASGDGVLGRTTSVQRVQTVGGKAPANACSQAQAGQELRVNYKATYYFYAASK